MKVRGLIFERLQRHLGLAFCLTVDDDDTHGTLYEIHMYFIGTVNDTRSQYMISQHVEQRCLSGTTSDLRIRTFGSRNRVYRIPYADLRILQIILVN